MAGPQGLEVRPQTNVPVAAGEIPIRRSVVPGREILHQINVAKEAAIAKALPSAVSIVASVPNFDFTARGSKPKIQNIGAGFVIGATEDEIFIATNRHVPAELKKEAPHATLLVESSHKGPDGADREKMLYESAKVVYMSEDYDVAFIAIDRKEHPEIELPPVALGTGKDLKAGRMVVTIGAPWALSDTSATGEISNDVVMEIRGQYGMNLGVQVDASVRPGNSGGMAIDLVTDEVVGVPTAAVITDSSTGFITIIDVFKDEYEKFKSLKEQGKTQIAEMPEALPTLPEVDVYEDSSHAVQAVA